MDDSNDLYSSLSGLPPELLALIYDEDPDMSVVNKYFNEIFRTPTRT